MRRIELLAYAILVVGVAADQISTSYILRLPGIYETNPIAAFLISREIWLIIDVALLVLGITIPALIIRISGFTWGYGMLAWPVLVGVWRFVAGVLNLCLLGTTT